MLAEHVILRFTQVGAVAGRREIENDRGDSPADVLVRR